MGPGEATGSRELAFQDLRERPKVSGVRRGVLDHVGRQGALSPVGTLVLLGKRDAEVLLEERGQSETGLTQEGSGNLGVEEARNLEIQVTVQQPDRSRPRASTP